MGFKIENKIMLDNIFATMLQCTRMELVLQTTYQALRPLGMLSGALAQKEDAT